MIIYLISTFFGLSNPGTPPQPQYRVLSMASSRHNRGGIVLIGMEMCLGKDIHRRVTLAPPNSRDEIKKKKMIILLINFIFVEI